MADFVHLHVHTLYSLLDGAIKIPELIDRVKGYGMDSVAITDHGSLHGVIDFYQRCKAKDVKPIIGCEAYVAGKSRFTRDRTAHHMVLLAKNKVGYQNLMYLISMGYKEGFYYKPRIDKELLRDHAEGLVATTACLGGEFSSIVVDEGGNRIVNIGEGLELCREYSKIFDPGSFFLELQENGIPAQALLNEAAMDVAKKLDLPLVATNDSHYLDRGDYDAHDTLMCVQTQAKKSDTKRMKHDTDAFYIKSAEEMLRNFSYAPEAVSNSVRIAQMCNVNLDLGNVYLPTYKVPEGENLDSYVSGLAFKGLQRRMNSMRYDIDRNAYEKRLELELSVITKMGFSGYFLIVWDFINYAKEHGIPVGPGRGSGAGSLVAYALRITDIDPIRYNLLFERFLNPERVSMPDFDIDFCQNRRDEVITYVTEKYGKDNVAQIATFGSLKAKAVVKDVGRVLDFSFQETNEISKLIPHDPSGKTTLQVAMDENPDLKKLYDSSPRYKQLIDISLKLEGLNRQLGIHAAGIVISEDVLWKYVPICVREGAIVSQYAKDEVEKAGLVKFDFLGLKTLTVIADAVGKVRRSGYPNTDSFNIDDVAYDDKKTYDLLSSGQTAGVFQVESTGFIELLKNLKPDCLEDIIAAVAIYRPGPLGSGMDKQFYKRKHGEEPIVYPHPDLEAILKETYGIMIYQEQVMQIAQILAGYSLGGADLLRRAMGKKKPEVMAEQRQVFVDGCKKKDIPQAQAMEIFDLMEKFAEYGFNKSHSAAYAVITYHTAYLKAHYPLQFMAAMLTSEKDDIEKVTKYIEEVRSMGYKVLPPDVNASEQDFAVQGDAIRFGLGGIKNVGGAAIESILAARGDTSRDEKTFTSMMDFCKRVDLRKVNKKVLESLVRCGAFDFTGYNRAQNFSIIEQCLEQAASAQRDLNSGQRSLFEKVAIKNPGFSDVVPAKSIQEWDKRDMLNFEKELLGFYVSGHPLDTYRLELDKFGSTTSAKFSHMEDGKEFSVIGLIHSVQVRFNDRNEKWARAMIEDLHGIFEFAMFGKAMQDYGHFLEPNAVVSVTLTMKRRDGMQRLSAEKVASIEEMRINRIRMVKLSIARERLNRETVAKLRTVLLQHRGNCAVALDVITRNQSRASFSFPREHGIALTDAATSALRRMDIDIQY